MLSARWTPPQPPAIRARPPCPRPAAPGKAWHPGLAPRPGLAPHRGRVPDGRRRGAPVRVRATAPQGAWDCGQRAGGAEPQRACPPLAVSVQQEADSSYLPGDRKPLVPPHPPPPPLAHGEPVPPPPPPPHLLAPPAASASPGVSARPRHGLHRTRRGGSHSSAGAQARRDRTHGARTAGRVASYYGGRFGLTSAPLPPPRLLSAA